MHLEHFQPRYECEMVMCLVPRPHPHRGKNWSVDETIFGHVFEDLFTSKKLMTLYCGN